ncbi:MAG: nitroreductase [Actinobacteria bacterium]|nr:nitroreductase [Actinomycetota bacterium]MCL5883575.1 nitroreductase [Actinomycetota bacterium]
MNVSEALASRYTCRDYQAKPVARETLNAIFAAATRAPSWANTQPWEIYVAGGDTLEGLRQACLQNFLNGVSGSSELARPDKWPAAMQERMHSLGAARFESLGIERGDEEARKAMSENNNRFFGAPAVAYICMDRSLTPWSIFDLGMLAQSIMLAAEELGVATSIAYNLVIYPDLIREALEIPAGQIILIGIALGYAKTESVQNRFRSPRRPLEEAVSFHGF